MEKEKKIGKNIKKPKKGYYYEYKGKLYKYRGKFEETEKHLTGLYNKNGKLFLYKKPKEEVKSKPAMIDSSSLIADILNNKDKVENSINEEEILTEEDLQNIFAPVIQDSNDILIKIIKEKLTELQIPVKRLKSRFSTPMEFNNYKRALIIRDSITIQGFAKWMDVLGFEWKIDIKNKED